jgi:glycosyltransferase involved in cell wall biosynthesis
MIIVTTLYNAEKYIALCLYSIMNQSYKDFKCYITDDLSTDNSVSIAKELIKNDDRFILIENKEKHYQGGNYDQVIRNNPNIDDNDVIVEIDGDDWLPDNNVLKRIHSVYLDNDVWITNGSFVYSSGYIGFSKKQDIDNLRVTSFSASHMRTWRAFLWRNIKEEDLKDENNCYWKVAGDLSFMFPMLEMAGEKHYRFLEDINYVYNETNPLNDYKVHSNDVTEICQKITSKKPYCKI